MARPSGRLCRQMAKTNSQARLQRLGADAFDALDEVLVGQRVVENQQQRGAEQDAGADDAAGSQGPAPCCDAAARPGNDQREGAGRQHHAGAEAEQGVLDPVRQGARNQHRHVPSAVAPAAISPPSRACVTRGSWKIAACHASRVRTASPARAMNSPNRRRGGRAVPTVRQFIGARPSRPVSAGERVQNGSRGGRELGIGADGAKRRGLESEAQGAPAAGCRPALSSPCFPNVARTREVGVPRRGYS